MKKEEEMSPQFSYGFDPEVLVRNPKTGRIVSAHTLTTGTKEAPVPLPGSLGGFIQADGLALEFTTVPATTVEEAAARWEAGYRATQRLAQEHGLEIEVKPSHMFRKDYLKDLPVQTRTLGCSPDFNAYTGKVNPSPNSNSCLRSTGCHLHIGWRTDGDVDDIEHQADCRYVIAHLESRLSDLLIYLDVQDKGRRRRLYGDWGSHRPKPYGVEWRTLSSKLLELSLEDKLKFLRIVDHLMHEAQQGLFLGQVKEEQRKAFRRRETALIKGELKPTELKIIPSIRSPGMSITEFFKEEAA